MVMRIITFKIDEELLEQVDLYAQKINSTRSEFIRKAIIEYLAKLETEGRKTEARIRIIE